MGKNASEKSNRNGRISRVQESRPTTRSSSITINQSQVQIASNLLKNNRNSSESSINPSLLSIASSQNHSRITNSETRNERSMLNIDTTMRYPDFVAIRNENILAKLSFKYKISKISNI